MQTTTVPTTLSPAMREFLDVVVRLIVRDLLRGEEGSCRGLDKPEDTPSPEDPTC